MITAAGAQGVSEPGAPWRTHRVPPWLPNAITILRVVFLGAFLLAMGYEPRTEMPIDGGRGLAAMAALLLIGASDLLDGYLARRFDLTSRMGVILDAAADKIAQLGITAYFVFFTTLIPGWFLALLLLRDVVIGAGTWLVSRVAPGVRLRHRAHGKAASALMFLLFVWTLLNIADGGRQMLLLAVSALVLLSTTAYVVEGVQAWRGRRF